MVWRKASHADVPSAMSTAQPGMALFRVNLFIAVKSIASAHTHVVLPNVCAVFPVEPELQPGGLATNLKNVSLRYYTRDARITRGIDHEISVVGLVKS